MFEAVRITNPWWALTRAEEALLSLMCLQAKESKALEIPQDIIPVTPKIIPGTMSRYSSQRMIIDVKMTTPAPRRIFPLEDSSMEPDANKTILSVVQAKGYQYKVNSKPWLVEDSNSRTALPRQVSSAYARWLA
ncbi:hypothetical protein ACHAPC_000015 [Botrytis cinerea]